MPLFLSLCRYDVEAMYFDATVRTERRAELKAALHAAMRPAFEAQLALLHATHLEAATRQIRMGLSEAKGSFSQHARVCRTLPV